MATDTSALSVDIPTIISPADDPREQDDDHATSAIVIDNGSQNMRAGYAGDNAPSHMLPTVVGKLTEEERHLLHTGFARQIQLSQSLSDDVLSIIHRFGPKRYFFDKETINCRNKVHPIQSGIITAWDDIEHLWHHIFYNTLKINPASRHVFMTEPPLNPKANREKITQMMFETFNVAAMYIGCKNTMQLYASGRTTGITLTCGSEHCTVAPISEGYVQPHAVKKVDIGGKHLTQYLHTMLNALDEDTPLSMDIVNDIKEKLCFVTLDINEVDKETVSYTLPDGNTIDLKRNVLSKCCEALFDPTLVAIEAEGVSRMVYDSIMKTSVSIRRDLYGNIVVSGGTSLLEGLSQRLQHDLNKLAPSSMRLKIIAPPEREHSVWIGGSILSSLSTFEEMWFTSSEYDDHGPSFVHRKCF
eukprot:400832_1